jgi:hypothetical protein
VNAATVKGLLFNNRHTVWCLLALFAIVHLLSVRILLREFYTRSANLTLMYILTLRERYVRKSYDCRSCGCGSCELLALVGSRTLLKGVGMQILQPSSNSIANWAPTAFIHQLSILNYSHLLEFLTREAWITSLACGTLLSRLTVNPRIGLEE